MSTSNHTHTLSPRWLRRLTATLVVVAAGVAGTEGRANFDGILAVPAAVVNNIKASPPFVLSPYGIQASPTVAVSAPGSTQVSMVCTNPN